MIRLFSALALSLVASLPAFAQILPGYDRLDLLLPHRARPVSASIWYPAARPTYRVPVGDSPLFRPTDAFMGAEMAAGKHALILLSHGSGGNADGLGWLSAGLAAQGAIVLAVDHPGSTSGDSSPRRSIDLEARAADLTGALDAVLADPDFAPFIDMSRIDVIGFSLGGATALGLGGVRFDGGIQNRRCADHPAEADCAFFLKGGADFAATAGFAADTFDARIRKVIAVDPAFGEAAIPESLARVQTSIYLINLGEADRLPAADVGPMGNDLAAHIPHSSYTIIAPANHFTFLAECKPQAQQILAEDDDDPICTDPAGASREDVHRRVLAYIAAALDQ